MLLEYWCSWMKCREILFRQKYRKSILSFFIVIKFQKVLELSLILKWVERPVAHRSMRQQQPQLKQLFLRHLKAGERGTGH